MLGCSRLGSSGCRSASAFVLRGGLVSCEGWCAARDVLVPDDGGAAAWYALVSCEGCSAAGDVLVSDDGGAAARYGLISCEGLSAARDVLVSDGGGAAARCVLVSGEIAVRQALHRPLLAMLVSYVSSDGRAWTLRVVTSFREQKRLI